MNDLEINKALARAIGYDTKDFLVCGPNNETLCLPYQMKNKRKVFRNFDYKDWLVAGPIGERYNMFPIKESTGWGIEFISYPTPQMAIALTIIGLVNDQKIST